jgi:putative RecB family exonuclease
MSEIWSHSRLASFEDCRRKFQYRYVLKIPTDTSSIEAFVGKQVHDVLERLYRSVAEGRVPSLPKVIARYDQLFRDAYLPKKIRIVRSENPVEFYRELGEHCLVNYYHEHYPFEGGQTIGIEERVLFDLGKLDGEPVRLQGFVDRIDRARDGTIEIHDYKTSARVPSQSQLDQDRQLALYQIGVAERFDPDRPFRLVWRFVRKGITRTSTRTLGQLDDLRHETLDLVRRVRSETEFPTTPGPLCRWCEFSERCPGSPERRADLPAWEEVYSAPAEDPPARAPDPGQLALPL